ncbi:UNVERIFIED_CONTAM: hypothetical protein K2H54_024622 [Gekko kuhli]
MSFVHAILPQKQKYLASHEQEERDSLAIPWWYCEGKELENSPDIHIIKSGNQHSLVIVEAFEEDTGRYSCFASNIYGTDSTSAEIYVEGASSSESESDTSKEEMDRGKGEESEYTSSSGVSFTF